MNCCGDCFVQDIYIYIKLLVFLKSLYLSNTNLLFSFSRYYFERKQEWIGKKKCLGSIKLHKQPQ